MTARKADTMSECTVETTVELGNGYETEVLVLFNFEEAERQTWDYPGSPEELEVYRVESLGDEILGLENGQEIPEAYLQGTFVELEKELLENRDEYRDEHDPY